MKSDTIVGVVQPRLGRDYFEDDGAPIKCPKCDSMKITEKIIGVVDVFRGMGPTCEAEYFCECGECVGFWAYGSWHPQYRESFPANAGGMARELAAQDSDNSNDING